MINNDKSAMEVRKLYAEYKEAEERQDQAIVHFIQTIGIKHLISHLRIYLSGNREGVSEALTQLLETDDDVRKTGSRWAEEWKVLNHTPDADGSVTN